VAANEKRRVIGALTALEAMADEWAEEIDLPATYYERLGKFGNRTKDRMAY